MCVYVRVRTLFPKIRIELVKFVIANFCVFVSFCQLKIHSRKSKNEILWIAEIIICSDW